jgi:hypothetical protein
MLHRLLLLPAVCLLTPVLCAHTVPTITVEAEFSAGRKVALRVNLDPRLFLSDQPATLPPVPATWWFEQDEKARAGSLASAKTYIEKNIRFRTGESPVEVRWQVVPVDSASAFPLGPNSGGGHLLAEHTGPLPGVAGDFKVTLDERAAVGLILLNSMEGKPERHPQAIFPGESSRGFKLPELTTAGSLPVPVAEQAAAPAGRCDGILQLCQAGFRHFAGDHLLVALVLAVVLRGRFFPGAAMLLLFQVLQTAAALAVLGGWAPDAPLWMQAAGWLALAAALILAHRNRLFQAALSFSIAGICHGLNLPHLHLEPAIGAGVLRDAALTGAAQVAVLALTCTALTLASRRERTDTAGMQPGGSI